MNDLDHSFAEIAVDSIFLMDLYLLFMIRVEKLYALQNDLMMLHYLLPYKMQLVKDIPNGLYQKTSTS